MRVLYVSHNGMLEGLGRSQVLAYLLGLARRGVSIDLLSYELASATDEAVDDLARSLAGTGVHWIPLRRKRDTRLVVKVEESSAGVWKALSTALAHRPDIVHGRSYLPTAVSDVVATLVPRARLLFDCRGLLGDEYVDSGHWTRDRVEYKLVKRYEARAFRRAEGVVVLTEALRAWIAERGWFGPRTHVAVVPCCVDLERFRFDDAARRRIRDELGVGDRLVVVYSGSLGSWYREADMARIAGMMKKKAKRGVVFLLLTASKPDEMKKMLRENGFGEAEIIVRKVAPTDMPQWLSAGDAGLSFILSCFSKKASSPTKVAEYLACGLPVVLNGDIGDQAELAADADACVVVDAFDDAALEAAADRLLALAERPIAERLAASRAVAKARFDLETIGVARYETLYREMMER